MCKWFHAIMLLLLALVGHTLCHTYILMTGHDPDLPTLLLSNAHTFTTSFTTLPPLPLRSCSLLFDLWPLLFLLLSFCLHVQNTSSLQHQWYSQYKLVHACACNYISTHNMSLLARWPSKLKSIQTLGNSICKLEFTGELNILSHLVLGNM